MIDRMRRRLIPLDRLDIVDGLETTDVRLIFVDRQIDRSRSDTEKEFQLQIDTGQIFDQEFADQMNVPTDLMRIVIDLEVKDVRTVVELNERLVRMNVDALRVERIMGEVFQRELNMVSFRIQF